MTERCLLFVDVELHTKLLEALARLERTVSEELLPVVVDESGPRTSPLPDVAAELGISSAESKLIRDVLALMGKIGKKSFVNHFWEYRDAFSCTLAHYICALGFGKVSFPL